MSDTPRFEAILDPLDLWCIWDNETDMPAEFAQMALVGLTEDEAKSAMLVLNNLYEKLADDKKRHSAA